jgi:protein-S-isoprenylcysteine O-methyltransferase Ste14
MALNTFLRDIIRPSTTRSTVALWAKSVLNAVLFFSIFMLALPGLADRLLPTTVPLPPVFRTWLAAALALAGVTMWVASLDAFSRHGRGTPLPMDAPSRLVTTGTFSLTRNPIMLGELSVIWAVALYVASLGVLLYAIAICTIAHVLVVRIEEPELRDRFGESYDDYCRRVPRWLPPFPRRNVT